MGTGRRGAAALPVAAKHGTGKGVEDGRHGGASLRGQVDRASDRRGQRGRARIDIRSLREQTGLITLDPGYANTGSCVSAITFIDGEKGILRYRGIPIEELAEKSNFLEVAYLLIYGSLPSAEELEYFSGVHHATTR